MQWKNDHGKRLEKMTRFRSEEGGLKESHKINWKENTGKYKGENEDVW